MEEEQEPNSAWKLLHQTMDFEEEYLSPQTSSMKQQIIDSWFDSSTISSKNYFRIIVSSSTHHVNIWNVGYGNGDGCDNNGNFVIGEDYDDVVNYCDVNIVMVD